MDTYRIRVIPFSLKQGWVLGIQFRTGYQNQAKSSLEQGQVSGGPAAHSHQNWARGGHNQVPGIPTEAALRFVSFYCQFKCRRSEE